jgi:Cerato-platanin
MIYFTTFILTLLLSHIARATPACGDVASPEELYDPTYADAADGQHVLPIILYNVTWTTKYDNKSGSTKSGACSNLARHYPHYKDFHDFPYIGGAYNVKPNNQYCGSCWNLTDLKTNKTISLVVLDSTKTGYNISKEAFNKLNGGKVGSTWLQAEAKPVLPHFCKIPT